jgi:hypothetical protein
VTPAVVFRPEAEDEVLEARQWYESRSTGLGHRFATAVDAVIDRIVANPSRVSGFMVKRVAQC